MSLAEQEHIKDTPRIRCTVCLLVADIDEADQETLAGWMADPNTTAKVIAARLNNEYGTELQGTAVSRHRRGDCKTNGAR